MNENDIGGVVVKSAIKVHSTLGPGLLEHVYEMVLAHELAKNGLSVERQVPVKVRYENLMFDEGFRADLILNNKVILELKAVEAVNKVVPKQLYTYLKLTGLKLGYVLNFNVGLMKDGIERVVCKL